MKRTLPYFLTFLSMVALFTQLDAFAQSSWSISPDDSEQDDPAPVSRVARLSLAQGDVSFLRSGVTEWAPAVENLPLLLGDQIFAARGARAEIQLARGNYIRLSENSELTIAQLSEDGAQFELTEGTAIIRLERVDLAFGRFEIDTPNSALVLIKDGQYRIEVRGEKQSELIVRGGEAEASTDEGSFRVRDGHRLLIDSSTEGRIELATDTNRDDWDTWSFERDAAIAQGSADLTPDDVTSYETAYNDFYGASDLSSYGMWTNYSSYGRCWVPRVGAGWAPYRLGQWIWIPSAGWSWLSSEPWGWAPYHYGRWSYISGLGWAWIPGFGSSRGYVHRDYHWRPALVSFFNWSSPSGHFIGWQPLAPGQRWHRPDGRDRSDDRADRRHAVPRDGRRGPGRGDFVTQPAKPGVTILPVAGFARGDRTAGRPTAPGRDHAGWIEKGARPGLPEITPSPVAVAPVLSETDRRRERKVAAPPMDVIRRPVVTRNLDAGGESRPGGSRARRLITPPSRGSEMSGPALIENNGRGVDRRSKSSTESGSGATSPRIRLPLPSSQSGSAVEGGKTERRNRETDTNAPAEPRRRDRADKGGGSGDVQISIPRQEEQPSGTREKLREERRQEKQQRQEPPQTGNREQIREERRQEKQQRQEAPQTGNREQIREERRQEKQQRQEPPQTGNREQIREERRQEKQQRQEAAPAENRAPIHQERIQERQPRQEAPRSENRDQPRQERRQEKEHRQPSNEQRKKP